MTPWEVLTNTVGWFFVVGVIVVLIVLISEIVIGVVEYYIKRWRKPPEQ